MKQINLLPAEVKAKADQRKLIPAYLLAAVLAVASFGSLWLFWHSYAGNVQESLANAQEAKNRIEQLKIQQQKIDSQNADSKLRIVQVNSYSKTELNWNSVFAEVAKLVAKDATISSISYVSAKDGLGLKMTGNLPSNISFANFVQFLTSNPSLTGPKVESYTFDPKSGGVGFVVSAKLSLNQLYYLQSK